MSKRKQPKKLEPDPGGAADDPVYLADWAAKLAGAVTPDELRAMIRDHEAIARQAEPGWRVDNRSPTCLKSSSPNHGNAYGFGFAGTGRPAWLSPV